MMTQKELFDKSKAKWGLTSQLLMLVEECNELAVATLHLLRDKKSFGALNSFAEEIADVELMLDEMKYYFWNTKLVAKDRKAKEMRLEVFLNE